MPLRHDSSAAGCTYWSYNLLRGDRWEFSSIGPQARIVRDGDVDGWAWGLGSVAAAPRPAAPLRGDLRRSCDGYRAAIDGAAPHHHPPAQRQPAPQPDVAPDDRTARHRPAAPQQPRRPTNTGAAPRPAGPSPSAVPPGASPGFRLSPPAGADRAPFDAAAATSVAELIAGLTPAPPGASPSSSPATTASPPPITQERNGNAGCLGCGRRAGRGGWWPARVFAFGVLVVALGGAWLWLRRRAGRDRG